ncbi:MAG TPA: hypothetical protein VK742_04840 [Candidatus Sulfotelmatobacter sp.]|jgi:hypothetical protein|nr:hypothetical protein [Candidatus Sulfotelmatobacter sp.]
MGRPRKIKFPIELDEFLRLALPKRRLEDRLKIYREHLRTDLALDGNTVIHRSDDEIIALIKMKRLRKFSEDQYECARRMLLNFLPQYEANNRKQRAQNAAAKRWGKIKSS